MHNRLLESLLEVAQVRLVASLRDPGLGFAPACGLRVFLPDMHLSSTAVRARYQYGNNCEDLLIRVLRTLADLRENVVNAGGTMEVYHIGDYLDLWRESLAPAVDERVALDIKADHIDLVEALEAPRLATHFLLGNHDFALWQWHDYEAWDRRFYLPGDDDAAVLVMHGDFFDWVESLPEFARDFGVHVFGRGRKPADPVLGKMLAKVNQLNAARDYSDYLQLPQPAEVGATLDAETEIPERYNVQTLESTLPGGTEYLQSAARECREANRKYELNMKAVIIGHTHHARIAAMKQPDGSLFTLIDTGAWIEQCRETALGNPIDNAQITALYGNEVRIYQLA
jgi:UDP-2,3-diacylglucosamine pyrophosphatase LpxH